MSTHNTDLDSINHICSLVEEIQELLIEIENMVLEDDIDKAGIRRRKNLIRSKASTIKSKAQKMENRLKDYRVTIESLGFKRIRTK